ncbi:DNA binding protein [Pseudomonas mohnii]|uniref:histone-like nucleoid-structuring protein, MvaT/MvaU family n=1 Tax=Pseudomonas mohnii TaxID=395600 RepID=UPI0018DBC2DF|nr:histone-like nucleoid-structuring protein, MvaT/MvaU family [Pseudomonas mohnii]MBH8609979.1 DNA binding protein [Pseudomonas mohnii]
MDKLAEVFRINRRIESEYEAAESLIRDKEVIKGLRFLTELDELATKYQFAPRDILLLLFPELANEQIESLSNATPTPVRVSSSASHLNRCAAHRAVRRYTNPHTGEVLETRGANHKKLKQWKAEFGVEVVEAWREPASGPDAD